MSIEEIMKSADRDLEMYQAIWDAEEFMRQRFETPEDIKRERIRKEKEDEKSFNEFKKRLGFSLTVLNDNEYLDNIIYWVKRLYIKPKEEDNKWRDLISENEYNRIELILKLENEIKPDTKKIAKF